VAASQQAAHSRHNKETKTKKHEKEKVLS